MDLSRKIDKKGNSEVDLMSFMRRVIKYWYLFAISLAICLTLAYFYAKWATPIYEVSTSLLIDDKGSDRTLGDLGGGTVDLIGAEKNLYNEMGIIKSHALIKKTLQQLGYNVSYHTKDGFKVREKNSYFPFEIELIDGAPQMYGTPIHIIPISDTQFTVAVETEEFTVNDPDSGTNRSVEQEFKYSDTFNFDEEVLHDYFNFIVRKSEKEIVEGEFEGKELYFMIHDYQSMTDQYVSSKLNVERTDIQASILKLTTRGPVIEKEIDFLKTLSKNYIYDKLLERDEIASSKLNFIKEQLANVADSLSIAERRLERFKSSSNSVNLELSARTAMENIQTLERNKGQVELNMKYYRSLLTYLNDDDSINKIVAPSVVGIDDPLLNENLLELKRLKSEQTKSSFYKGKKSYDLEILNKQIKNTTKALRENIRNLIKTSEIGVEDREGRIAKIEKSISTLPKSEKRLASFERKRALHENLYNYLSQELAKTGIARAEDIADTRILDEARMMEGGPIAPQKMMIMLLAGIIGLLLPLLWIIFTTTNDDTIQELDAVERYSEIPILTSVAQMREGSLFKSKDNTWQMEESFRDLSANLRFLVPDLTKNIIGVTSTMPGEGKTFCAINLAINIAKSGKKVLLIDTDLRKDSPLSAEGNNQAGKQFLMYLRGEKNFDESMIVSKDKLPNFHFIPTDVDPNYNPELLSSSRFKVLLGAMKVEYDYVIVDSPAVGVVSDYLLISNLIDVHLFIIRKGISKISYVDKIEQLKEKGKMENVFLVYNGVNKGDFKYGVTYGKPNNADEALIFTDKK